MFSCVVGVSSECLCLSCACVYTHTHSFVPTDHILVDSGITHTHVSVHVRNSYMTLIGVSEMHGRMDPNQDHVTNLFAIDPLSLFGYLTVGSTHPVTGN